MPELEPWQPSSRINMSFKETKFQVVRPWRKMTASSTELAKDNSIYLNSYRIASLQAWRTHLESRITEGSLAFFLEAQNDALTSHVFASLGSWRSALKALRSCIDNVLFCVYYKDHSVELDLWHSGKHKPSFNELFNYMENHPARIAVARMRCDASSACKPSIQRCRWPTAPPRAFG